MSSTLSASSSLSVGRGGRVRARFYEIALLLVSPAAAFWVMSFIPIGQAGFLDPYIYTGYINNFDDLFHRYGVTYYGVRFGLIAPAQLANALVGPVGGYFLLRYVYALVAAVPFFVLMKQRFGRPTAATVFCLLLASPYFARALLWDHPDASGVPFLFAALCLFLVEHRRRWILDLCAGLCAGLAVHSNVFVAAPLGIFLVCHTAVWLLWKRGAGAIVRRGLTVIAGIGVITAVASAYYWWRVAVPDIFSVTIEVSRGLAQGGMAAWRTPGAAWLARQWSVLTPVFLALIALFVSARRQATFQDAIIGTSATATTAFFYVVQFGLNGNSLELFYYFSYLLPFVFLSLGIIVGTLLSTAGARTRQVGLVLLLSAAIGSWVLHSLGISISYAARFESYLVSASVSVVAVLLWRLIPRGRPAAALAAVTALGLLLFSSFSVPIYAAMIGTRLQPNGRELDVYRVALQFLEQVPKSSQRPGTVAFWYSNEPPGNLIQSVQSTYLWGFSKVQGQGRGLPYFEAAEIERLRRMNVKWLVLLAEQQGQLALGRAALRRIDVEHQVVDRRVLSAGMYTLHFELLELRHGS